LDMTNSKLDTIKRYTATTTNSLIKNDWKRRHKNE
jgi:hypothetical protein